MLIRYTGSRSTEALAGSLFAVERLMRWIAQDGFWEALTLDLQRLGEAGDDGGLHGGSFSLLVDQVGTMATGQPAVHFWHW